MGLPPGVCKSYFNLEDIKRLKIGSFEAELILPKNYKSDNLFIYFHGGAYIMGSSAFYRQFCSRLAQASSFPILVPDYPLAPGHQYPGQIIDALTTYK